jgi:hypothetical protein
MDINALIQVTAMSQPDIAGKAQADIPLDRSLPLHGQDQAVEDRSHPNTGHRRYPARQRHDGLFEPISRGRGCLPGKIKPELGKIAVWH